MRITWLIAMCLLPGYGLLEVSPKPSDHMNGSTTAAPDAASTIELDRAMQVRHSWKVTDKLFKSAVSRMLKSAMPTMLREIYSRNVSSSCLSGLLQYSNGIKNTKLWAFRMLDSSGRFPVGFLSGTLTALGNYDECVNVNVDEGRSKIQGKYCMIDIIPPMPEFRNFLSVHFPVPELVNVSAPDTVISFLSGFVHNLHILTIRNGICVPSQCSVSDVHNIAQMIPERLGIVDHDWKVSVSKCEIKRETELTSPQILVLCLVSVIVVLLLIGTATNSWCSKESFEKKNAKGKVLQLLRCFSVVRNGRKISSYVPKYDELRFLNGIMFFSLYWIATAHAVVYMNVAILANFAQALILAKTLFYQLVYNRIVPMQFFIFIGAFMTTYKVMKSPDQSINVWRFFLKAYWRFTPTYMLMIAVLMLSPILGSGPAWMTNLNPMYEKCRTGWWENLLYINNYVDPENSCLDHTWLLAVSAQLHVLGLLILIPLKIRPSVGLMLNFVVAAASLVTVALTNTYYNLPPNDMIAFLGVRDRLFYAERSYYRVYSHMCTYCAGIFVGYFMAKNPNLKISPIVSFSFWVVCCAGAAATLFSIHQWNLGLPLPSALSSACYAAFSKLAMAVTLSWVCVYCIVNQSGILTEVLGWRPFVFLGRLTFIFYLIHPVITQLVMSFRKTHMFMTDFESLYNVMALFVSTYVLSYAFHLTIEAPLWQITEVLRRCCGNKSLDSNPHSNGSSTNFFEGAENLEKPIKVIHAKDADDGDVTLKSVERSKC